MARLSFGEEIKDVETIPSMCQPIIATNLMHRHSDVPQFYLTSCDEHLANLNNYNCSLIDSFLRYEIGFHLALNCGLIQTSINTTNHTYLDNLVHRSILYDVDNYCNNYNCDAMITCINQTLMLSAFPCYNEQLRTRNINIGLIIALIIIILIIILTYVYGRQCQKWILRQRYCFCCCRITQQFDPLIINEEEPI